MLVAGLATSRLAVASAQLVQSVGATALGQACGGCRRAVSAPDPATIVWQPATLSHRQCVVHVAPGAPVPDRFVSEGGSVERTQGRGAGASASAALRFASLQGVGDNLRKGRISCCMGGGLVSRIALGHIQPKSCLAPELGKFACMCVAAIECRTVLLVSKGDTLQSWCHDARGKCEDVVQKIASTGV